MRRFKGHGRHMGAERDSFRPYAMRRHSPIHVIRQGRSCSLGFELTAGTGHTAKLGYLWSGINWILRK